jgi:hypothetical protein
MEISVSSILLYVEEEEELIEIVYKEKIRVFYINSNISVYKRLDLSFR